jgi:hypothetical protein
MWRISRWVVLSCFLTVIAGGCAANRKTVRTETTTYPAGETRGVERETTVTTTESEGQSGGLISGTVDAAGEVISLPFRAVGGLARAIF